MKEATGELNMTVVTVVAIAALAAAFYLWVWPMIQMNIAQGTCDARVDQAGKTYKACKKQDGGYGCQAGDGPCE